jgi:MSHA biogenesis protein MshJ
MNADLLRLWWKRRKPRERLLVLAVAVLTLLATGDSMVLKPVRIQAADAKQRLEVARAELDKLERMVEERDRLGSETFRTRQADLKARLSTAESEIHRAQIELVSPKEMDRQLSAILHKFPELRVVAMASDPPALVDESPDKSGKVPVNAEARRSMLYQHGLELTIEGRYLDLINYLQQLESAPYKIYWRELDLKAGPQGTLVTKIRFFTLSRGPTWLTL